MEVFQGKNGHYGCPCTGMCYSYLTLLLLHHSSQFSLFFPLFCQKIIVHAPSSVLEPTTTVLYTFSTLMMIMAFLLDFSAVRNQPKDELESDSHIILKLKKKVILEKRSNSPKSHYNVKMLRAFLLHAIVRYYL